MCFPPYVCGTRTRIVNATKESITLDLMVAGETKKSYTIKSYHRKVFHCTRLQVKYEEPSLVITCPSYTGEKQQLSYNELLVNKEFRIRDNEIYSSPHVLHVPRKKTVPPSSGPHG
eukprot:TRINITY_DN12687_c0_g1_i1.p1 TRINITY_DN12687_c0_g1~~TRINITY_DN12687_c0_g1_i1.p1  ORF type:complete len:116 (-),score=4.28 TRINITY_DN12687_c0_g1_i1:103-450(-)